MSAVTLINSFEVPAGREEEFLTLWKQVNTYMQTKPGYRSHRLYRSLASDASFRFVNVARWDSLEHFQAAHDHGFHALVSNPAWATFPPPHPCLYEVVHEGPSAPVHSGLELQHA